MSWQSDALAAAKHLVLAAGAVASIGSTNIDTQARAIAQKYSNVSTQQIRDKISDDIKTLRK